MFKNFDLQPLDEKDIIQREIPLKDLWVLKSEENTLGPFETSQLRELSEAKPEELEGILATNLIENNFKPFFSHIAFQRRQPKLVQSSSLVNDDHFLAIINGQKSGPYTLTELEGLLKEDLISYSSQISTDRGQTWIKVYEHYHFDRRKRQSTEDLPFVPNNEVLQRAIELGQQSLFTNEKQREEEDALVGLAFTSLGHTEKNIPAPSAKSSQKRPLWQYATLCLVLAFGAFNFMGSSENLEKQPPQVAQAVKKSRKVVKTKPAAINNSNSRRATKRAPASIPRPLVEPKRTARIQRKKVSRPKKAQFKKEHKKKPRRITHFADDFDSIDVEDPAEKDKLDRALAGVEDPDVDNEERLTQDEIEAIEMDEPEFLDPDAAHEEENY